ncbi:hypothetical protein SAMN05216337_103410 [Bradyrhizobium brasilense]|uniref:Uncharacterized protein n=1 Tax=Bradyrhizobium brasilense TaxID=1419277 RepID=A0A1G7FHP0_9BRAD|nr:hypothetical protein SAMN05216337_103410 [Bradyrhizobium brasilense]
MFMQYNHVGGTEFGLTIASQHGSLRVTVPLPRSLATAIARGMIPGARC